MAFSLGPASGAQQQQHDVLSRSVSSAWQETESQGEFSLREPQGVAVAVGLILCFLDFRPAFILAIAFSARILRVGGRRASAIYIQQHRCEAHCRGSIACDRRQDGGDAEEQRAEPDSH